MEQSIWKRLMTKSYAAALFAFLLLLTSCASDGGQTVSEQGAVRLTETVDLMETLQQVEAAFQSDSTVALFDADSGALRAEVTENGVRVSAHWGETAYNAYFAAYAESGQMLGAAVAPDGVAAWETEILCGENQAATVKMFRLDASARPVLPAVAVPVEASKQELTLTVAGQVLTVEWEDNASVEALRELAAKQPVTVQMSPYGGFEQVGSLGASLPREDAQTTTNAGDIVLYQGNQIVIFYGSNSWAYTRLGKISGLSRQELQTLLGGAGVTAILSLAAGKPEKAANKILVAYFSATGTTKGIAARIAEILDADSYEITPAVPYTSADLNYNDRSARATVEQNDASARPAIAGSMANMEQYDVVFLGYPIWWGEAPRIISAFLESYDFAGKTVVPFCTSGSSPIGNSAENLHALVSGADWKDGRRFAAGSSRATVEEWVNGLSLPDE